MSGAALLFSVDQHVARITINRPHAANTVDLALAKDLFDIALTCERDRGIRAILLTATGKTFCAGGDLKSFAEHPQDLAGHLREVTAWLHGALSRLVRMDAPLVGAVNGAAAGAGLGLVCACDLVIAAESARFTMAYTRAGLTPDASSSYHLPRIVGIKRALELTLTNRILSASEAEAWGIVTRVVADSDLLAEATSLAAKLARGATRALGAAKRLLHSGLQEGLETHMEHESRALAAQAATTEALEGIRSFIGKRAPEFIAPGLGSTSKPR